MGERIIRGAKNAVTSNPTAAGVVDKGMIRDSKTGEIMVVPIGYTILASNNSCKLRSESIFPSEPSKFFKEITRGDLHGDLLHLRKIIFYIQTRRGRDR